MFPVFTNTSYGLHRVIAEYGFYPKWLPLPCYFEHGISTRKKPSKHELATEKKLMLVYSERRKAEYSEFRKNIRVEIMGAPQVHYRQMRGIEKIANATDIVVFPSHSTEKVDSISNYDSICEELLEISKSHGPVKICLHWHDIKRNKAAFYNKFGFEVVTAGPIYSKNWLRNFYNILKNAKLTCSNDPGSYSFFSIEMGIPFFIVGKPAVVINNGGDPNYPKQYSITDFEAGKKAYDIFNTGVVTKVSNEQIFFVEKELGLQDCLTRDEMHSILHDTFRHTSFFVYLNEAKRFAQAKLFNIQPK